MKKRFSRRHNALITISPWTGPLAIGLGVVVLLFVVLRVFFPGILVAIGSPLWIAGNTLTASVGDAQNRFTDFDTLVAERDALKEENETLRVRELQARTQAEDLVKVLGTRTEPAPGVVAAVLTRPPVSPYDVLVIDQGAVAGVREGALASGNSGVPVGRVEEVSARSARVRLFSAPGAQTESWVGENRLAVLVIGEGSGAMRAEVSRDAGIQDGDMVYAGAPGAMPIGSVVGVQNDPSLPRMRIDIRPITNPFSITWVTVAL